MHKKREEGLIAIILLIVCTLTVLLTFNGSMNYDEFFSMNWTALSWKEMMEVLSQDVHPPLYYIGLKAWRSIFGNSVCAARMFSAIPSILLAGIGGWWLYRKAGSKSAVWYLVLLFGNPFMFQKAVEIRMYSWTAFWIILNAVSMHCMIVKEKISVKYFVCFFVSGIFTAYNHYFGVLIMIMTYGGAGVYFLYLKNKKKLLLWLAGCGATVLEYIPWLFVAVNQVMKVNGEYWIEFPESRLGVIRELFYSIVPYSEKLYMGILLLVPIMALILLLKEKKAEYWWALTAVCAVWGVFFIGTLYMYVMERPIMTSRYLIPGIILAVLGSAMLVRKLPVILMIPCFVIFGIIGGDAFKGLYELQKERTTEKFVEFAEQNMDENDRLYFLDDGYGYLRSCLKYYITKPEIYELKEGEMPEGKENIWYLEAERMAEDSRNQEIEKDMEYRGEYSFGTEKFAVYSR